MTDERDTHRVDADRDPAARQLLVVAGTVLADGSIADRPWTGLTMFATLGWWDPPLARSITGYYYTAEPLWEGEDARWEGVLFDSRDEIEIALLELAQRMAERDETTKPWTHCLMQIDRASEGLTTKFSYDDESPWEPDFARLDEWVESMRPVQ